MEQVTAYRWVRRRRRREFGGRRWWGGNEIAATPSREWIQRGGDSLGGAVSARKLAASLLRLAAAASGGGSVRWKCGLPFDRLGFEFCSSASIPKSAEGVTKFDNSNSRALGDFSNFKSKVKCSSISYPKQSERVSELERVSCIIKKLADDIKRERRNCKKMDIVNLKLLRDIAETKLSARRFARNLKKEKKARVELDEVCENLAKEMEGNKAKIGALRNHRKMIQMEVGEERKMLQIAEVWREEQVQMKMVDAKFILEDKYAEISNRVADLKVFMDLKGEANVMRKAKVLRHDSDSDRVRGVKNFMFKFPKSDKELAIIKESQGASEITSLSLMQSKKKGASSACKIHRAWHRSKGTCKMIRTDGSSDRSVPSTVSIASPQGVSGERDIEVRRNPHVVRAMKGHIEWPRKMRRRELTSNRE